MATATQIALAGTGTVAVVYGLGRYGFGLFVPIFRSEFDLSVEDVGLISSAAYAAFFVAMATAGFLSLRFGPRSLVCFGLATTAAGMALTASAWDAWILLAGTILVGTGPGFCWAPFSDAVNLAVRRELRSRVLSVVSTGTTFGLIISGPAALLAISNIAADGGTWRYFWAGSAAAAMGFAIWTAAILPAAQRAQTAPQSGSGPSRALSTSQVGHAARGRILLFAFVYGFSGAVFFTYAADVAWDLTGSVTWGTGLWALIGLGGVTGVFSGDVAKRFGLRLSMRSCSLATGAAIVLLPQSGGAALPLAACALLYGGSYMPVSALLVIWSGRLFDLRPGAGFSIVLFCLACGAVAGPALMGFLAERAGMAVSFGLAGSLMAVASLLVPRREEPVPKGNASLRGFQVLVQSPEGNLNGRPDEKVQIEHWDGRI